MKKVITLALTSTLLLAGCGKEEAKQDQTVEQLMARVGQLEEENKQLKAQLEQNNTAPSLNQEQEDTTPTEQTSAPEETTEDTNPNNSLEQTIQAQPGNTQSDNYFVLETRDATYTQTGDAFIEPSEYGDKQVLVIPVKYKNTGDDTSSPWMSFATSFRAYQEDDVQEYTLNGGSSSNHTNDNSNIKSGAEIDTYIVYELENPDADVTLGEYIGDNINAIFKVQ